MGIDFKDVESAIQKVYDDAGVPSLGKSLRSFADKAAEAANNAAKSKLASFLGHDITKPTQRLGVTTASVPQDQKVILEYTLGGKALLRVEAMMPPNFNFELTSTWAPKDAMGLSDAAKGLANLGSAHYQGKAAGTNLNKSMAAKLAAKSASARM
jgi:hypothetical protein